MEFFTKNGFIIRPVSGDETELQAVLAVYRQCEDFLALGPVDTASMPMVLADLALAEKEGGVFYAIYDPTCAEMVGVVDFVTAGFEGDPHLAYLSLLMIAAPHRGHGLGAEVVQAVEQAIRDDGRASAIKSGVQVNNPGGIGFWQRMGYAIVSGPIDYPDGTTAFDLWKPLESQ